jgi:hypothetical protein
VDWSASPDGQSFLLSPRPHHTLDVATDVQVAYSVVAATATLPGKGRTTIVLSGAVEPVARARGLLLAVLTLEADQLLEHVRATATEGDYVASQSLTSMSVVQAETVTANDGSATCRVTLELTVSVRLERALRDTEGALIERVATVGSTGKGQIAVEPAVDA